MKLAQEAIVEAKAKFKCDVKSFVSYSENKMKRMRSELAAARNDENGDPFIAYGCGAHALNLLMGDIARLSDHQRTLENVIFKNVTIKK